MDALLTLGRNLLSLLTLQNILLFLVCSLAGIIFGCLPGLTASIGIALLTGFTYGVDTDTAMVMLMSIYVGAIYGGSISAVLIGIPGTGSAAATVLDGHVLARRGEARTALSLATISSFIGTLFGMLCLALLTPLLLKLSLNFTSVEFTLLAIFGITICGSLTSAGAPIKGWISGFLGLFISNIGFDSIFSYPRFTYGSVPLLGGINFVPAMIGLFGLPAVFITLSGGKSAAPAPEAEKRAGSVGALLKRHIGLILKSGLIGSFIGTIPGVGEDVAAWLSYDTAKRSSKHPEEFGKGSYEGVIAAETANNACIGGAMIPLLSLGVPGSGPCAVLLGALTLHGIRTGPMLETANPGFILKISAIIILAALFMRFGGLLISRIAPKLLSVPSFILMPIVGVLCVVGSYAIYVTKFDIYSMFFMGLLGYLFDRLKYPTAPAVLGVILGSLLDSNLRRSLMAANGSLVNFFTRPIAVILLVLIFFSVFSQTGVYRRMLARLRKKGAGPG